MVLFILFPLLTLHRGEVSRGLWISAVFGTLFARTKLGHWIVLIVNTHVLKESENLGKRLSAALSAFGFTFLPALVGSWTNNTHLNTEIDMHSLGPHFLCAYLASGLFFCVSTSEG